MVAKTRNVDAGNLAGLKDSHTLRNFNRISIYEDFDSVFQVGEVDSGPGDGSSLGKIWRGRIGLRLGCFGILELTSGDDGAAEERSEVSRPEFSGSQESPGGEQTQPHFFWVLLLSQIDRNEMRSFPAFFLLCWN